MSDQLPGEAIAAAVEAILNAPYPKVGEGTARNFAQAALKAAAPALRAQGAATEREACAQLMADKVPLQPWLADLIRARGAQ